MDRKWRVLVIVCVAIFMLLLDVSVVNVSLPVIQRDLHASFTDMQWVIDAYTLLLASVTLNAGTLGDWLGRKRVFIGGTILFTLASALCGSASTPVWLHLARGAQGVGGAVMFAVSLAIVAQEFHGKERGTAFGLWGATIGAAVAIGPMVGGVLTDYAGWRWIFLVNVPIGALCVLGALRELHESRDERHAGLDLFGMTTLTGGLFALVLAILRGNTWGWSSAKIVGLFAGGAALLIAFVLFELRKRDGMLDVHLFRKPAFAGAQALAFTVAVSMFSMFLYLALYMQNILHLSAVQTGLRFLPVSLLQFVCAPVAGRLSARVPVRWLFGAGMTIVGVALLLMHGVTPTSSWTTLLPGFILGGIGVGFVNAPLASTAVSVVEPRRAGMASGVNNTFRQVGLATGIAVLGAILESTAGSSAAASGRGNPQAFVNGFNSIVIVAAVVAFAGAALGVVLVRPRDFVASGPAQQPAVEHAA